MNKTAMFCGSPAVSDTSPSTVWFFTGFTFKSVSYRGQNLDCPVFITLNRIFCQYLSSEYGHAL